LRYSNRAVGYSNEAHRLVKEAIYGANSNGFGGEDLFFNTTGMEHYKAQTPKENNLLYPMI